ncbi:MAG: type I restriction endonuclease subunit S [Aquabacterium sp.]
MSFPRYPEYKDSGAAWLGQVPSHWSVIRTRWLCQIQKRIVGELGYDVLSITQQGIKVKDIDSNDGQLSMDYSKYQLVEVGDFAMNHMDLLTGYVDIATTRGVTSPDYRVFSIRDRSRVLDKYLLYLFQSCYHDKVFYAFGQGSSQFGRWRLPTENFNDFVVPLPSRDEQLAVVNLLDAELAKIDALVAEQEQLITLLKEKRQAVISHAVTKGLDPSVPMKDSGVEWLGEVPAHWEVKALKFVATVQTGVAKGKDNKGKETVVVPYLRVANVQDGYLALDDMAEIEIPSSDLPRYLLRSGDVLMNEGGDFDKLGRGHVWRAEIEPCIHQNHVFAVRPHSVAPEWLNTVTSSSYAQFYFMSRSKQSTNLASISSTSIMDLPVVLPPSSEQAQLLTFLEGSTAQLQSLIEEAVLSIELLRERRSALISAAVTGQIDVRDLAADKEAA